MALWSNRYKSLVLFTLGILRESEGLMEVELRTSTIFHRQIVVKLFIDIADDIAFETFIDDL